MTLISLSALQLALMFTTSRPWLRRQLTSRSSPETQKPLSSEFPTEILHQKLLIGGIKLELRQQTKLWKRVCLRYTHFRRWWWWWSRGYHVRLAYLVMEAVEGHCVWQGLFLPVWCRQLQGLDCCRCCRCWKVAALSFGAMQPVMEQSKWVAKN